MRRLGHAGLVVAALAGTAAAKGAPPAIQTIVTGDEKWVDLMGAGGPQMSVLWGNPMKGGDSGFLLKLPGGFVSPPHSHSGAYWATTVSGTTSHWNAEGGSEADAKPLPAGAFVMMPAKLNHVSKCAAGADCVVMIHMIGKFDFVPMKEKSPARPAAPK